MTEMILIPVVMVRPSRECIYTPSRLSNPKEISKAAFLEKYADYPRSMLVSFEADGFSNPKTVTAYGRGLDCWWIVG